MTALSSSPVASKVDSLRMAQWQLRLLRASLANLRSQLQDTQTYMASVGRKLVHEAEEHIRGKFRVFSVSRFYRHLTDKQIAAIQRPVNVADSSHLFKNFKIDKYMTDDVDNENPPPEIVQFLQYQLVENSSMKEKLSTNRWQMTHMESKVAAATALAKEKSDSLLRALEVSKNCEDMLAETRLRCHTAEMENLSLRTRIEDLSRENMAQRAQFHADIEAVRTELTASSSPKRRISVANVFAAALGRRKSSSATLLIGTEANGSFSESSSFDPEGSPTSGRRRRSTVNAEDIDDSGTANDLAGLPRFLRTTVSSATQTDFVHCSSTLPPPRAERSTSIASGSLKHRPSSCRASFASPAASIFEESEAADPVIGNEKCSDADTTVAEGQRQDEGMRDNNTDALQLPGWGEALVVRPDARRSVVAGSLLVGMSASASVGGASQRPGSAPAASVVERLYKLHDDWAAKLLRTSEKLRRDEETLFQHSSSGHDDPSSHHVGALIAPNNNLVVEVVKSPPQQRISPPREGAASSGQHTGGALLVTSPRPPMSARPSTSGCRGASGGAAPAVRSPERLRLHNTAISCQKHFMITPAYEPALKVGVSPTWSSAKRGIALTSPKRR
jgi:hypothetical protein